MTAQLHLQAASRRVLVAMIGLALLAAALVAAAVDGAGRLHRQCNRLREPAAGYRQRIWDVDDAATTIRDSPPR